MAQRDYYLLKDISEWQRQDSNPVVKDPKVTLFPIPGDFSYRGSPLMCTVWFANRAHKGAVCVRNFLIQ